MKSKGPRAGLKRQLWRLLLASKCIVRVRAGCVLLSDAKLPQESPLHYVTMAGIIVTYAKPFTENKGVGQLNDKFSTFSTPDLRELHNELLNSRNQLYGHQDISGLTMGFHVVPIDPASAQPGMCEFDLIPVKLEKVISGRQLPKIKQLCDEIDTKLRPEYRDVVNRLFGDRQLAPGLHLLKLDDES